MTSAETGRILDAIDVVVGRFGRLVHTVPADAAVPATPGWSVADVVGHVAMEPWRYAELVEGRGEWPAEAADLPAFNARQIAALPTRDVSELVDLLRRHVARLRSVMTSLGEVAPLMTFDGGRRVRADRQIGTLLGEVIVHGRDIADAAGEPWPIDPAMVPLVYVGLHQVLPGWVDPIRAAGHTATYELRLRGSESYVYEFTDGALEVDPPSPRPVSTHISSDPVTALLTSYGRIGRLVPAVTGKVAVWGRRPWLALGLRGRFLAA